MDNTIDNNFFAIFTQQNSRTMKTILLLLLLLSGELFSQSETFLWIINPKIGVDSNETLLLDILDKVQTDERVQSVIVTGSITSNGSTENLKKAKQIFNGFPQVHLIPGENETKAAALFGTRFTDEFENSNFSFLSDSTDIIGINNAANYISGQGYFSIEDTGWLTDELENVSSNQNIIIFTNHALDKTINATQFLNNFSNKKLVAVFSSDFTKKSYNQFDIATPSSYSSKRKTTNLKIKLIKISNYEISIKDINLVDKNTKWKNYKLSQTPLHFTLDKRLQDNGGTDIIWQFDTQYSMIAEPVIYNDKIITADKSGLVSCLNIEGKKLWDYDVFGDILCSPAAADGYIAIGTAQGDITTININSGESLQTIGFDEAIITPLTTFEYNGNKRLMIPKTGNSKAAITVGTESGSLYCLDMQTLEEIWHSKITSKPILGKPLSLKNNLYFTSTDGYLYCLDSRDGTLVWKTKFGQILKNGGTECKLIADKKNIFLTTTDGYVYSINAKLGKINWGKNYKAWQSVGISSNYKKLFVLGTNGRLNIIKPKNGKTYKIVTSSLKNIKLSSTPLFSSGMFFLASPLGNVIRISKKYSYKTILSLGNAPLHAIQKIGYSTYLASNFEGKLVLFKF